ncbi:predicted protein [Haematococcus lacustris]|uniref:Expansin-like EG45 domain-containing protein n=1 Tax=Haematococcus lacustris TaxID=44745 RepID=A0A6A0AIR0_HAELA|nr:predicted protein [Haematococcus lacustris]
MLNQLTNWGWAAGAMKWPVLVQSSKMASDTISSRVVALAMATTTDAISCCAAGYGNQLDRKSVCYDESATVVVQITDVCPCNYPTNYYSNKRWCCGDMYHLDISTYAFEKLADKKWGVIAMKYRQVPCGYVPNKVASVPRGSSPSPPEYAAPWGWSASKDKRPRFSTSPAQSSPSTSTVSGIISSAMAGRTHPSAAGSGRLASRPHPMATQPTAPPSQQVTRDAECGAIVLQSTGKGTFSGKKVVDFWIQRNSQGNVPNLVMQLLSSKGGGAVWGKLADPAVSRLGAHEPAPERLFLGQPRLEHLTISLPGLRGIQPG